MAWKVVDQTYLQLCEASNPAHIHSWGMFLQKLGVELCLAIRERAVILTQDELVRSPSSPLFLLTNCCSVSERVTLG